MKMPEGSMWDWSWHDLCKVYETLTKNEIVTYTDKVPVDQEWLMKAVIEEFEYRFSEKRSKPGCSEGCC